MIYSEFGWETRDGIKLHAYRSETTHKPKGIVCVVHGLGEHSNRYRHVAGALNEAGYSFAAFDQRGHGKSQGQRGHSPNLETSREDVATFLDKVKNTSPDLPIFLYGHSLGGLLVLSFTAHCSPQLDGVISSGPILRPGFDPPGWQLVLGRLMRRLMPTFSMPNGLDRSALSRDTRVVEAYNTDPLVHDRVSAQLGIDFLEEGLWLLQNSVDLNFPILLIHGSSDRLCSPQASLEFAETAGDKVTIKMWEGLYHEIHNEPEKDQVFDYIIQWLNEKIT